MPQFVMTRATNDDAVIDYLLGWMSPRARRRMTRRIDTDPVLASLAAEWQTTLGPLDTLVEPVAPPDIVWRRIIADLNAPEKVQTPNRIWVWAVSGGAAIATVLAVLMATQPRILYQTELQQAGAAPIAVAKATSTNDLIVTDEGMPALGPDKAYELWIIPAGGKPQSLGVMPHAKVHKIHLASLPPHATLAVSIEPAGGSPVGAPTGPVVVSGELHAL